MKSANNLHALAGALASTGGVDALWPECLAWVRQRRGLAGRDAAAAPSALHWSPVEGLTLDARHWSDPAQQLFALLQPVLARRAGDAPWVIGQLGQSLDGFIATHGGDANYVNGTEVLLHLHRLRALCDAVIVGADTAAIDNPQLTTRRVEGDNPVRVVLDPKLRLDPGLKVFTDGQAPTLLVCDLRQADAAAARVGAPRVLGVPQLLREDGSLHLRALLDALAQRGLRVLFVEGGGVTVSRFMAQQCLDRLHLSVAPVVIGDGRPGLQLPRSHAMRDCLRPPARVFAMGEDMLWDLALGGT